MRVAHITLHAIEGVEDSAARGALVRIDDVIVWPHAGWYADLVLEEVTGPQFGCIEDAVRRGKLKFRPEQRSYNYRQERAYVQVYNNKDVQDAIASGALTTPRKVAELAKKLEKLIREIAGV